MNLIYYLLYRKNSTNIVVQFVDQDILFILLLLCELYISWEILKLNYVYSHLNFISQALQNCLRQMVIANIYMISLNYFENCAFGFLKANVMNIIEHISENT